MSFRSARVIVLSLSLVAAAATVHGATASRQQADSLARKITQITERGSQTAPAGVRKTEVSEDEVNSWFVYRGRPYLPDGVTNPTLAMIGDGTMRGAVTVDLESVGKQKSGGGGLDLLSYLGKVPVEVIGTLRAHDGRGQFEVKSAEVAGVPVPKAVLQQLLSRYASSPDDKKPISLDASFELPAKIRSIDVGRGQLVVVQ